MAATDERRRRNLLLLLQQLDEESRASAIQQLILGGGGPVEDVHEVYDYVSLSVFAAGEDEIICSEKPIGYVGDAAAAPHRVEDRTLSPRVQVAIWLLLQAFVSMLDLDLCPDNITADNITLDRASMKPKLIQLNLQPKTPARVENCMRSLATVLEDDLIVRGDTTPLPFEIKHLLITMKTQAVALLPVISYHPALVPKENRPDYLTRMYEYIRDVLQRDDKAAYDYVLSNVFCPEDWDARLKTNDYLDSFFNSAPNPYNPQGQSFNNPQGTQSPDPKKKAAAEKEAAKESIRYNRNLPAHGLEMAVHRQRPGGMIFTRTDMGQMLYSVMDGILCSVAVSLQRMGHFTRLKIQSLFPGRVVHKMKP